MTTPRKGRPVATPAEGKTPTPKVVPDQVPVGGPKRAGDECAILTATATTPASKVVPFNPLEHEVLGASIAQVLAATKLHPLATSFPLEGAGIYAIYYTGDFEPYEALSNHNKTREGTWPIYVGQALPAGARKGIKEEGAASKRAPLRERLKKHQASITEVEASEGNLKVEHFTYRALVLNDTFIRLGEMSLLGIYAPVWNKYLDGFGNNPAGKNRADSEKSQWDTVHPGRKRAQTHSERVGFDADATKVEMRDYLNQFNLRDGFLRAEGQTAGPRIDYTQAEELEAVERENEDDDGRGGAEPSQT
jgi:hypothetical protein